MKTCSIGSAILALLVGGVVLGNRLKADDSLDWQIPNEKHKLSWKEDARIVFVNRNQNFKAWQGLKAYWNPGTEKVNDPVTGQPTDVPVIYIKVPLGLSQNPPVPLENPMTFARWELGRKLYFDPVISSDGSVSCASCHDPKRGYSDQSRFSTGIAGKQGGASAPTVINAAYHPLQFWDGRAISLEDQAQGPPQNPSEMFDGKGHAWNEVVKRVRANPEYVAKFKKAFGTEPTRDAIAKAIATYERTVLAGNSIVDRAEVAMKKRVNDDGGGKFEFEPIDFEVVLKEAAAAGDKHALDALKLPAKPADAQISDAAKAIANGRALFFGKARCTTCHTGDNYSDGNFHNLGVGVKDGKLPADALGRFGSMPTGHKNPEFYGAFKTPILRHLVATAPYMHDGSEATLEAVIDLYDRGGNANAFLSPKMRDLEAEAAWLRSEANKTEYKGPKAYVFDGRPIVPLALNLTPQEKANLVLFMRALQGDPVDPIVADPKTAVPVR